MSLCPCAPTALTSVAFADGTTLVRCALHEQQAWLVDGRPAPRDTALDGLKVLFTEQRYRRAPRPERVRTGVVDLVRPTGPRPAPPAVVELDAPDSERLTALLQARGLPGTWAVA